MAAAADATEKLPNGTQMPKPWARLIAASRKPPKISEDGVLLGETQLLTYAGLFHVTDETDKPKAGGDDFFYLQAICRAPTASSGDRDHQVRGVLQVREPGPLQGAQDG